MPETSKKGTAVTGLKFNKSLVFSAQAMLVYAGGDALAFPEQAHKIIHIGKTALQANLGDAVLLLG